MKSKKYYKKFVKEFLEYFNTYYLIPGSSIQLDDNKIYFMDNENRLRLITKAFGE